MWSSALALFLLLVAFSGGHLAAPDPYLKQRESDATIDPLLYAMAAMQVNICSWSQLSCMEGVRERLCLQLSHLNESVTVNVILELKELNETLLHKEVTEAEEDNCVTFKISNTNNKKVGFITTNIEGSSLHFKSRRSILIIPSHSLVFIQTDKPIYKADQTVLFRIASLDENFFPTPEKFSVVYIEDPDRNRLSQWLNVETQRGITQETFALSSEPRQGTYKVIAVTENERRIEHSFTVEEYVLPKYEVVVTMPPVLTILDEEFQVTVCGRYTYGKPVSGVTKIRVCRMFTQSYYQCPGVEDSVCEELSHHTDINGCTSDVVNTKLFQMQHTGYEMKINAFAKLIEDGTDVEMVGEGSSEIVSTIAKVSFRELDSNFRWGIPLYGQVFLQDAAGHPMSNETVKIFLGYDGTNYTYTTGPDGTADFSIDTSSLQQSSLQIRASYKTSENCYGGNWVMPSYQEDSRNIQHAYSRSKSYVKVQPIHRQLECNTVQKITVHYILTPEGVGETRNAAFHYLIMAKGSIVEFGKHSIGLVENHGASGDFSFHLNIGASVAPLTKVLVYLVLDSGEVIADSISFKVNLCFGNQVKLSFASSKALPGSQAGLNLQTEPKSLCAVRGVDQSVLLLKPEAELSARSVYNLLPIQDLSDYLHDGHYLEEHREDPCLNIKPIFMNGVYYNPTSPEGGIDAYKVFKSLGLKVFTNNNIRIPYLCVTEEYTRYDMDVDDAIPLGMSSRTHMMSSPNYIMASLVIETVRKYFPETWIWQLVETDSLGSAQLPLTVPDSITTWKAGMFCTSKEAGFGLSETVSLVAFQPFFVDVTLPYSAIRGEKFTLKATVANYLQHTIKVHISLANSDQFLAKSINEEESYCVDENNRVTVSWEVTLHSLGEVNFTVSAQTVPGQNLSGNEILNIKQERKDTITKHILVEPEGLEKEETQSAMICGKGADSEITELISLKLPDHVVEGSARAYFSVIGDVMGTAMQNLRRLLQMPYGCGEQNMALFTPNIFILEYLNKTGQLNPETKEKALSYLSSGYQRQLNYKHSDGSYSAFGPRYGQGNTWLTAFVMKSFARARSHIYIEEKQISDALLWLSQKQKPNGCFQSSGQLFNNALKGGVDDEITLSAYITIALLEYPLPIGHPVVRNALFCLETAQGGNDGIYTQALMAHAFTLAGYMDQRDQILQSLNQLAIKEDNTLHWHRPELSDESSQRRIRHRRAPSVEVEITSYVLLALLSTPIVSEEHMTLATSIVTWLVKQQNPNGGFSSTQDTVVALQALSLFGSLSLSHDSPRNILLSSDSVPIAKLHVEDSNRLLLQRVSLPKVPGDYTASITGPGCLFMQTSLRYNVPHPKGDAAFTISVMPEPQTCDQKSQKSFSIAVIVSYVGAREKSNMAVVEIKLPSGYFPVKSSVKQLTNHFLIKRTDTLSNKVIVYFDWLSKEYQSFKFLVEQDIPVSNLQPATATVYDYYETDEFGVTKYSAPCTSKGATKS